MIYLILLIIISPILLSPLGIDILFLRKDKEDKLILTLKILWGAIKIPINVEKAQEEIEFDFRKALKKIDPEIYKRILFLVFLLKGRVKSGPMRLQVDFSLGEAALTGMVAGFMWSSIGGMLALLRDYMKFTSAPQIAINPEFTDGQFLRTYFFSSLQISMLTVFKVFLAMGAVLLKRAWFKIAVFWQRSVPFRIRTKEG